MPDVYVAERANAVGAPRSLCGAAIGGVGVALPATVKTNAPIAARLGVDEDWIVARTGVRERRVASADQGVVDLAAIAAARSLEAAAVAAADIDLVLVATMSHDQLSPAAAPLVAERIGARRAGAIDLDAACAGFVSAIALGASQIESGRATTVLVIGADLMHRLLDHDDRATAALFGDGAGAVLLRASEGESRIGPVVLGADGARAGLITVSRAEALIRMKGPDTFRQAVDRLCESSLAAAAAADSSLDEIDVFVYHQANKRILEAVAERLGLDRSRVVDCIARYGNTSAATVPIALADARDSGLLRNGSRVLMAAFGGGLAWAATVAQWGFEGSDLDLVDGGDGNGP